MQKPKSQNPQYFENGRASDAVNFWSIRSQYPPRFQWLQIAVILKRNAFVVFESTPKDGCLRPPWDGPGWSSEGKRHCPSIRMRTSAGNKRRAWPFQASPRLEANAAGWNSAPPPQYRAPERGDRRGWGFQPEKEKCWLTVALAASSLLGWNPPSLGVTKKQSITHIQKKEGGNQG